jgi:hypothetical protein
MKKKTIYVAALSSLHIPQHSFEVAFSPWHKRYFQSLRVFYMAVSGAYLTFYGMSRRVGYLGVSLDRLF